MTSRSLAPRGAFPCPPLQLGLAWFALAVLAACSPAEPPAAGEAGGDPTPAAHLEGETITVGELDAWVKDQLFAQQTEGGDPAKLYEIRREALDELIHQRLLAREASSRGVSVEELIEEAARTRGAVSEEDVIGFYEQHKAQLGDTPYEEIAPQIRNHLQQRRGPEARQAYVASLRESADVDVLLDMPRVRVDDRGPGRGPEGAPVTIVEFSDYQCPFCHRAEAVVQQVLERYPEEVRFVYRHFPLDRIHPQARPAAEAAVCAEEQGRFWEYHERLFAEGAEYDEASLARYAAEVELDLEAFQACREQDATRQRVEDDVAAGRAVGVTGTPAFFVNGIRLSGARPLQDFVALIESELEAHGERS
jgi:protein-disulfide isomerase